LSSFQRDMLFLLSLYLIFGQLLFKFFFNCKVFHRQLDSDHCPIALESLHQALLLVMYGNVSNYHCSMIKALIAELIAGFELDFAVFEPDIPEPLLEDLDLC